MIASPYIGNTRLLIILLLRGFGRVCFTVSGEFVDNFGSVFAILLEVLLKEFKEEIHHLVGWEGEGGYVAPK